MPKAKAREAIITIHYPGAVISVNHYKFKNRYTKPEAKAWMEILGWQVLPLHLEDWRLPITICCSGVFKDRRSIPDLSNLGKCILDSIEDTCGVNDRNFRWQDGTITISNEQEPMLTLIFKEARNV